MNDRNTTINNDFFNQWGKNTEKSLSLSFITKDISENWEGISDLVNLITKYNTLNLGKLIYEKTSFVVNELIENAIKFSKNDTATITINTLQNYDKIFVKITNQVSYKKWISFKKVDSELKEKNLKELFLQRIANMQTDLKEPGIGLILIKKDYTHDVQFVFYKLDEDQLFVSVIAELDIN